MVERDAYSRDLVGLMGNGYPSVFDEREDMDQEFFISLPYSNLAEWIYDKEEVFKAFEAFPTWRLHRIKALSFLVNLGDEDKQYFDQFGQTRLQHTLLVSRVSEKILRQNNFPENTINISIAAGVLHDIATPALGDAIKPLDLPNLHEEENWKDVVDDKGWSYLEEIGTTPDEIDDIIHNKGLLGEILDIADRISYVMVDAGSVIISPRVESQGQDIDIVLLEDTKVGNIYQDVKIDRETNKVYFTNPERLKHFLEIRAILHKDLYLNHVSQSRDLLIEGLLRRFYTTDESSQDLLTPKKLRRLTDDHVLQFLADKYEVGSGSNELEVSWFFINWVPKHKEFFENLEDANTRKKEVEESGKIVLGIKNNNGFNTGVGYNVLTPDNEIVPLKEYDPEFSERLQRISDSVKRTILFYEDSENVLPRLKQG